MAMRKRKANPGVATAIVVITLACFTAHAHAFLPRWWSAPPPAAPVAAVRQQNNSSSECPADVIEKLRGVDFDEVRSVCPKRSDVPHDVNTCAACSCGVYNLIKEAIAVSDDEVHTLADACGPIFSLDTAFEGLNTKAIVDFLDQCRDIPEQIDFKTCKPIEVNAMNGPSDNLNADDMLKFLTTNLTGVTDTEIMELLHLAEGLDLADDTKGLATEVEETISVIEDLTRLINLGDAVVPETMNDSSILCPGFTTPGSCDSFEELRRICPWSCERQKEECAYSSPKTCETTAFQEACPVTCRQIEALASQLPISLEGAIQITSLTDGSAIKANNLKGSVEEDCLCFNVFQPVCNSETGEMYTNLCQAACQGAREKVVPCRTESMQAVMKFAEEAGLSSAGDLGSTEQCSKHCEKHYDPVCSKSEVYENMCYAKCDFVYDAKPCAENIKGRRRVKNEEDRKEKGVKSTSSAATSTAALASSLLLFLSLAFGFVHTI